MQYEAVVRDTLRRGAPFEVRVEGVANPLPLWAGRVRVTVVLIVVVVLVVVVVVVKVVVKIVIEVVVI